MTATRENKAGPGVTERSVLKSPETLTTIALLVASTMSLLFINSLIAAPKALFGRALSAIPPSMFPAITLTLLMIMCVIALVLIFTGTVAEQGTAMGRKQWLRAILLFGIMILYALTMLPFGFLISSTVALTLISLQMGARSVIQIGLLATISPIALYLTATRLLAVSLPELNSIELFYARVLSLL